jgi:FKBP-type peptidyl-prolyl cis-trans isomerase
MIAPNESSVYKKMSPAEQLSYAKNFLERKNYRAAINHLDAIPKESPLFAEVEMLRQEIIVKQKQQEEILKQEQAAAEEKQKKENALVLLQARKAYAKTYEEELLQSGRDANVTTQGQDHSVLQIRYILMDKQFVHNLSNNSEFMDTLRQMGFKKLRFTNGYDESWTVNL